jgi:hypothetical protein
MALRQIQPWIFHDLIHAPPLGDQLQNRDLTGGAEAPHTVSHIDQAG